MDTTPLCPNCGKPLDAKAPKGLCPACLMQAAFATGTEPEGKSPRFNAPTIEELAPQFPQLEILEFVGQGGMGAVYKARQKELDRIVALKILPPGIGHDPSFAGRFSREAKALAKLNHPGIVTLYEFGRADLPVSLGDAAAQQHRPTGQIYFFLMEFVDGVNLRQLLNTSRISAREALAIVPQICDALQYAHDQGIVHRDIKPENVLLDRRGRVKVADFGLAKIVGNDGRTDLPVSQEDAAAQQRRPTDELTDAGKVMGTPQYMSPEQINAPGEVDHRADIYALGVVFYQMLTGELPGKRIEPPSKKVHIDVRLDEIVLRALEKKPELRYQQASVLKTQIETIASSPTVPIAPHAQPSAEMLLREKIFIGFGTAIISTGFFVCLFFAFRYPHQALAPLLVMVMAVFGLVVCGLRITGYWPFPSLLFPRPNFSSRNLYNQVPATTSSAPTFDVKDARWKTMAWGFVLMLGSIEMATHSDPVPLGWAIGIWGVLLWIISTVLALLAGDDRKTLRIACGIAVIDGLGVAVTALWLARTNPFLPTPWRDTITVGCAIGIVYCLRKLYRLATLQDDLSGGGSAATAGPRGLKPRHILALIGIVLVLLVRNFGLQPFIVRGGGVEPELPVGSHILVWKLGDQFIRDDIVAYHHENQIWVARVAETSDSGVTVNRNGRPDETIPQSQIVGKVVSVYWRATANVKKADQASARAEWEKTIVLVRATNQVVDSTTDTRTVGVWTDSTVMPGEKLCALVKRPDGDLVNASGALFTQTQAGKTGTSTVFTWSFKEDDGFGVAEAEAATASIRDHFTKRPLKLTASTPLELFSVTNEQGATLVGYIEYLHFGPQPADETGSVRAKVQINYIRDFAMIPGIGYSAQVPSGYALRATSNIGEADTHTPAGPYEYESTWFLRSFGQLPGNAGSVNWNVPLATNASLRGNLRMPGQPGYQPFEVILGEPKLVLSITNGAGEVFRGFLELVGPTNISPTIASGSSAP